MGVFIGGREVRGDSGVLIIAEAGINHDGKLDQAFRLIDAAADAGADVVKFQLFRADRMYPEQAGAFRTADGKDTEIYPLIKSTEVPEGWIPRLMERCGQRGVGFLCTTCDEHSTDLLCEHGADALKIASSEITHIPLLAHAARKGKTVIISEGAATMGEVCAAIDAIREAGNDKIVLMHCTAEYPARLSDCNVNVIETYRRVFPDVTIGFSDHTMEPSDAPVQAVLRGARVIEKHFTLSRGLQGADHCFSLEPDQLGRLVRDVREAESHPGLIPRDELIGGRTDKAVLDGEKSLRRFVHRGIFASRDIRKGEALNSDNMVVLRPGNCENGIEPAFFDMLSGMGARAVRDIGRGRPVRWEDVINA